MQAPIHVKATPVNGLVAFVSKDLSAIQVARVLAQLPPDQAAQLQGKLLAHEQVPLEVINRYTALAAAEKGEAPFQFGRRAGRFGAELGLKTVYKFIMALLSPGSVLRTAPVMWKKVYDGGRIEVEARAASATIRARDFPADPTCCGRITGWFEIIGERSAKNLSVRHTPCVAEGGSECAWEFEWTP